MKVETSDGAEGLPRLYALLESTRVSWLPTDAGALLRMAFVPKSGLRLLASCIGQVHLRDYEEVCLAWAVVAAESGARVGDLFTALHVFRSPRRGHAKHIVAAAIVMGCKRLDLEARRWFAPAIGEIVVSSTHGHARCVLLAVLAITPCETSVRVVQALRTDVELGPAARRAWRRLRVLSRVPEWVVIWFDWCRQQLHRASRRERL